MSRKALCSLAVLAVAVAWSALLVDVVRGACPDQDHYNRQCLETVPVCAGPATGCNGRIQKTSSLGQFGCKYNEDSQCLAHPTTYANCYWLTGCVWGGGACVPTAAGGMFQQLIKTTLGC